MWHIVIYETRHNMLHTRHNMLHTRHNTLLTMTPNHWFMWNTFCATIYVTKKSQVHSLANNVVALIMRQEREREREREKEERERERERERESLSMLRGDSFAVMAANMRCVVARYTSNDRIISMEINIKSPRVYIRRPENTTATARWFITRPPHKLRVICWRAIRVC